MQPEESKFDQVEINELVERKIVKDQQDELTKAIFGFGEYRLSSQYSYLAMKPHQCFTMSLEQRKVYSA